MTKKLAKPGGRYLAESWNLLPTEAKKRNGSVDIKIGGRMARQSVSILMVSRTYVKFDV